MWLDSLCYSNLQTCRAEVIMLIILCIRISCNFSTLCSEFHALFSKLFSRLLSKQYSNSWNDTLLEWVTTLLEYYNAAHKFNNLLTVLLKYINLFLLHDLLKNLFSFSDYLLTNALCWKLFQHNFLTPTSASDWSDIQAWLIASLSIIGQAL